jgi:ParB-like chromosome segregation protein Spo0J
MKTTVHPAFALDCVTLPLSAIHPIRQVKPTDHAFGKYKSVLASIKEIDVIEPLVVHPQKGSRGAYLLLDGHLRLKALMELGRSEAICLVANDDDAFTYNDKINRLSLIQEHRMIMRAVDHGVTPEQIAKALAVDVGQVKANLNLLDGIHPDAIELLKDKPISDAALRLFKKVKSVRQIDMAQLMTSANNYARAYADALIVGTAPDQMVKGSKAKKMEGISEEEVVRMEKEMEALERDCRYYQDNFGENSLHLNSAQRYVKRLLENNKVRRFLESRHPEYFDEFQEIVVIESL